MLRLLLAILAFFLAAEVGQAAKRDIFGLTPGSTIDEVKSQLKASKLDCDFVNPSSINCRGSEGAILLRFTVKMQPSRLIEVRGIFNSDDSPYEMMTTIAMQFGLKPTELKGFDVMTSANTYVWSITSGEPLILSLCLANPPQLILYSGKLDREDSEVGKKSTPKF